VLETMIASDAVATASEALRQFLAARLGNERTRRRVTQYCLRETVNPGLNPDEDAFTDLPSWLVRFDPRLKRLARVIRHPPVQLLLAAQRVVWDLAGGKGRGLLHRPMPADRRGPGSKPVSVTLKSAEVAAHLSPGFGRDVFAIRPDEHREVAEQAGLHRPIYLRERRIVASLRCRNGASQRRVGVAAGSVARGAHPKCAVRRATIRPTERLPTTRGICGAREIARQPPHRCTIPSGWCLSAISRSAMATFARNTALCRSLSFCRTLATPTS